MSIHLIHLIDVATVSVDTERSTIKCTEHEYGQRLGVGFSPEDPSAAEAHRRHIEALAEKHLCVPPDGEWQWLGHNGQPASSN